MSAIKYIYMYIHLIYVTIICLNVTGDVWVNKFLIYSCKDMNNFHEYCAACTHNLLHACIVIAVSGVIGVAKKKVFYE